MGGTSSQQGDSGKKQRDLRFDGFMGAVLLFTHDIKGKKNSGYFGNIFWSLWGAKELPWGHK